MNFIDILIKFYKKNFGTLKDAVFTTLLICSLILNVSLYLSLGDNIFDKFILGAVAACIQFLEVFLLLKMKRYWGEKEKVEGHPFISFFKTIFYKRLPAVIFTSLYLVVTTLTIGAAYAFSLKSIYNASINNSIVLSNEENIKIKEDELKGKDKDIASLESQRDNINSTTQETDSNASLIEDYKQKITTAENNVTKYYSDLSNIRQQLSLMNETDTGYQSLKNKEKTILNNITSEQGVAKDYKAKKNALMNEDATSVSKAKKESEDKKKEYQEYTDKITKLREDKISINEEIKKLKEEDEKNRKAREKTQYQLVAENLTAIFYSKENEKFIPEDQKLLKKKEITEEQVRATLLGIFSVMIEVGLLLTAPVEHTSDNTEKAKTQKKKTALKLDKRKKKEETFIDEIYKDSEEIKTDNEVVEAELDEIPDMVEESIPEVVEQIEEPVAEPQEEIEKPVPQKKEEKREIKIMSLEKEIEKMMGEKSTMVINQRV